MAPKGTCRGRSTRVGQVARAALKRNFHRAAGRILCRRLKYATGYCKWQSGLAAMIHRDSALCRFDSSLPPYSLLFLLDQRPGFNTGCIVPTLVKIFNLHSFPMYIASLTIQSSAVPTRASPMPCKKNLSVNSYNGPMGVGQH
ncbi:hypothetical protein V6N13_019375 [Hibiscus sabdariffa]